MLLKNKKTNNKKRGSDSTILADLKADEHKDIRTTDDQIPKSDSKLRANPGRAILYFWIGYLIIFYS